MEVFNKGISAVSMVVNAIGLFMCAWGLVTLGIGMKDKTGPQIAQGVGTLFGGILIVIAAQLITQSGKGVKL